MRRMAWLTFYLLLFSSLYLSPTSASSSPPTPTPLPTIAPTRNPTNPPTPHPTATPTHPPTPSPTPQPTPHPTANPSSTPTANPSFAPTDLPTPPPGAPSQAPTTPTTGAPRANPTKAPTFAPTVPPTPAPSDEPTQVPTPGVAQPTHRPTRTPTTAPTHLPSPLPTPAPTPNPTIAPTVTGYTYPPTSSPTLGPTPPTTPAPTGVQYSSFQQRPGNSCSNSIAYVLTTPQTPCSATGCFQGISSVCNSALPPVAIGMFAVSSYSSNTCSLASLIQRDEQVTSGFCHPFNNSNTQFVKWTCTGSGVTRSLCSDNNCQISCTSTPFNFPLSSCRVFGNTFISVQGCPQTLSPTLGPTHVPTSPTVEPTTGVPTIAPIAAFNITTTFQMNCALWLANVSAYDLNYRASLAHQLNVVIGSISTVSIACGSVIASAYVTGSSLTLNQVNTDLSTINFGTALPGVPVLLAGVPATSVATSVALAVTSAPSLAPVTNAPVTLAPSPPPTPIVPTASPTNSPAAASSSSDGFIPTLSMAISLIVVVIPGAVILIALIILILCCCGCCARCKSKRGTAANPQFQLNSYPPAGGPPAVELSEPDKDHGALEDQPLPPGWKVCRVGPDDGHPPEQVGQVYYFNEYKGWSEWDLEEVFKHPRLELVAPMDDPDAVPPPVFGQDMEDPAPSMSPPDDGSQYSYQPYGRDPDIFQPVQPPSAPDLFSYPTSEPTDPTTMCMRPGCDQPFQLRCPTCLDQGLPDFSVCSQECLVLAWPQHSQEVGH